MKFDLTDDLTKREIARFKTMCRKRKVTISAMLAHLVIVQTRRKPKTAATV